MQVSNQVFAVGVAGMTAGRPESRTHTVGVA